jgi:formylglycine-generating enzyme required for sulfatase activity
LRKELKQAAGESNAGLAAELEALQNRIRDDARERDELELRLGERSAQYEAVFAEARKLQQQLEQAQASARQAEQQLVEANQQANQEMTVRIEAEEKAQQALRGELATIIGERNRYQEQLDAVRTSMDELGAQSAALGKRIQTVEQERDSALESQLHTRQELEKLTAAAEAWRDAGAVTDRIGDAVLSAQLEQARQSVNEAERLRQQAESKISSLEARIQQLVTGQKQADVGASDLYDFDEIESFKETSAEPEQSATGSENSGTTVWLGEEQQNSSATDLLAEDGPGPGSQETHADLAVPDVLPAQTAEGGGRKGLLLVALVGLAAGGWWLNRPQVDMPTVKIAVEEPPLETEILKPEPESQPPVAVATDVPAEVEQLVPAAENDSPVLPVHDDHKSVMPDKSVVQQPAPEVVVPTQPVRSFSDALSAGGHGPKMVEFYAAAYAMGSGASSPNFDERPRHQVQLKRFALSADEVTFADYDRFTSDTGRRRPGDAGWGRGNRPVINVHWGDALAYTRWLSAQTGQRYRLPTEAEWEFAARSGAESRYWWGNSLDTGHANCFDCGSEWSGRSTAPVGSLAASPYGVSDMSGNVMEWTQDCYRINYDGVPTDGSAVEDGDCSRRVVRGGAYDSPSDKIRASSRDSRAVDAQLDNLGFRVVKEF